jgi:predicted DNA-binding protein with PD1-like motif
MVGARISSMTGPRDPVTLLALAVLGLSVALETSLALGARSKSLRSTALASVAPVRGVVGRQADTTVRETVTPPGVRVKLMSESAGGRTYQLVLAPGTEAMGAVSEFVTANHIASAHFEGLGACTDAVLAYWDPRDRDYHKRQYHQQMEIVSVFGEVAPTPGDGAGLHAHMAVAFADGTMHGGHLFETHVSPTMELVLTTSSTPLQRHFDEDVHGWLLNP